MRQTFDEDGWLGLTTFSVLGSWCFDSSEYTVWSEKTCRLFFFVREIYIYNPKVFCASNWDSFHISHHEREESLFGSLRVEYHSQAKLPELAGLNWAKWTFTEDLAVGWDRRDGSLKIRREKTQTHIQTFLKCFSPVEEREGPAGRLSCAAFIHLRCERVILSHSRCQDLGYHPGSRDTVGGRHPGEDKSPTCASLSDNSRVSVFIQKLLSGKEAGFCQLRQNTCFFFFFFYSLIFFFSSGFTFWGAKQVLEFWSIIMKWKIVNVIGVIEKFPKWRWIYEMWWGWSPNSNVAFWQRFD